MPLDLTGIHTDDLDLVERLLRGDEKAWDELFKGHVSVVYRQALERVGGDAEAARTLARSALARALPGLPAFRGDAALSTWLGTLCGFEVDPSADPGRHPVMALAELEQLSWELRPYWPRPARRARRLRWVLIGVLLGLLALAFLL